MGLTKLLALLKGKEGEKRPGLSEIESRSVKIRFARYEKKYAITLIILVKLYMKVST